jgi:DNA-binding MarR family transcriptional regulator
VDTSTDRDGVTAESTQVALLLREAIAKVNRRLRQTRPLGELTVAQAERVQPPTMTRIVARLEEHGLVQRTPHPTDGRQVILAPSAEGRAVLDEYQRVRDEWLANRLAGLTPEERKALQRAAEILTRIAKS